MRSARAFIFVLWLARRRLARRVGANGIVGLGIAAGAIVLAAVSTAGVLAQDRHLQRRTAALPEAERGVKAFWFGVPRQTGWRELDRDADAALGELGEGRVRTVLRYRQTKLDDRLLDLGAADGLGRWIRLERGRLPERCRPERCEVVRVGGQGQVPSVQGLRLVQVGRGSLASGLPFGELVSRERDTSVVGIALRYHTAKSPPFVLAEGVEPLAAAAPLATIFRSYGWVIPLPPGSVHPWDVQELAARVATARSTLEDSEALFDVTAPVQELEAARAEGETGARRLLLVGGQAAALLLAFAVLAASAFRRDAEGAARRLAWQGARRWQMLALPAAEAGAVALLAVLGGWAVGSLLGAAVAHSVGAEAGTILRRSALSTTGLVTAGVLAAAAWLLVVAFLRARPVRLGGAALTPLDVAALGAAAVVVVILARGPLRSEELGRDDGSSTSILILPGLVGLVAAVAAARALGPALRLGERLARRAPIPVRLGALALARRPGRAAVAVGFLAVSFGLALFAEGYRSTLARGQEDRAAFAAPADFVLRQDVRNLVPVGNVRTGSLGSRVSVQKVLRRFGDVARLDGGLTLLGLRADELERIDGWRADFAALPREELARRIARDGDARLRGTPLPPAAAALAVAAFATGDDVTVAANVETPRGEFVTVPLGQTRTGRTTSLRGELPEEAWGGRLVGLTFGIARVAYHDRGEGEPVREPPATTNLTLGALRAGGAPLEFDYGRWVAAGGVHLVSGDRSGARMTLILTNEFPGRLRPAQPTDGRPVPAIASPRLAAAAGGGGVLPLRLTGDGLRVRVVAVAEQFPTAEGEFVVADRDLVSTALNSDRPGAAVPNELWLDVPSDARAAVAAELARPPFAVLDVTSQQAVLSDLRASPLARATLLALLGAALCALVFALAGLLLVVITDKRDESGELFDLEAQGADEAMLRSHLRVRAAAVATAGLCGGLVAGVALSVIVVDFVTLTAEGAEAEPPLVLALDWTLLGLAAAGYVLVAAALIGLATAAAFRAGEAGRPAEGPA